MRKRSPVFEALEDHEFYGDKVAHVHVYDGIHAASLRRLTAEVRLLNAREGKPIVVHMNTAGGDSDAGNAMAAVFMDSLNPICTLVEGVSFSASTKLSVLSPYRVMTRHSVLLIHDYTVSGVYEGRRECFLRDVERLELGARVDRRQYMRHTALSAEELDEIMRRDVYLPAQFCEERGMADRVIDPSPPGWTAGTPREDEAAVELIGASEDDEEKGVSAYESVRDLDALLRAPRAVPVRVTVARLRVSDVLRDVVPLAVRLCACRAPVVCVIDADVGLLAALPALFCARRVMSEDAYLTVDVTRLQDRRPTLRDTVHNTELVLGTIKGWLRWRTNLPAHMIATLEHRVHVLDAAACLRYGVVDEVVRYA